MSVVSEIKKGSKKIKAAQLDRITDISGRYFAEYNSSTGECKNPVAEPITNIVITGNSTKVNADPDIPNDYVAIEYIQLKDKQYINTGIGSFQDIEVTYQLVGDISEQKQYAKLLYNQAYPLNSTHGAEVRTDRKTFTTVNNTKPISIAYNNNKTNLSLSYRVKEPNYLSLQLKWTIGASSETANVRVYNVKFTNNADTLNGTVGKIDGDFYPVIRKSDNKPGMYDKVSKQFFVNQGTGEFITGPELPGKILEVDTLTKRGKNLINMPDQEYTQNGVKITVKNGLIILNGTSTGRAWIILNSTVNLNKGFYYFNKHKNNCLLRINENTVRYIEQSSKFTINEDNITIAAQILQEENVIYTNKQYIMSVTKTSTEQIYEPYQQPEVIDLQPIHGIGELKDKVEVVRDVEYNNKVNNVVSNVSSMSVNCTFINGIWHIYDFSLTSYIAKGLNIRTGKNDVIFTSAFVKASKANEVFNFGARYKDNRKVSQADTWEFNACISKLFSDNDPDGNITIGYISTTDVDSTWTMDVKSLNIINLTKLFGAGNEPTTLEDFYLTPIGKLVQKGVYLPYSESNNRISKVTRYRVANKIDLGTFDYNLVTLDGNPGFVAKSIPPNIQRGDTSITDAGYKYDGSLSKDRTFNTYRGSGGPWFRNDAFTRDQQGCDDLKASLSGKYLLYPLLTPYYEDITDTPQGQALLNLTPYQPYTTEFEVNNDGTIEFGYWRQIDPLPDTYTRVKALVSDGNQKITVNDIVGKNIWDEQWENKYIDGNTGKKQNDYDRICSKNFIPCFPNTVYYAIDPTNKYNIRFSFYDENYDYIGYSHWLTTQQFTTPSNAKYMQFIMAASYGATYNHDICIMEYTDGMDTSYVPYISSMQNNSLEMTEPKKTLFQNKDNRVLSVDGYALKYNQLRMNSYSYTNNGITITANGGYETIVTGTSQSSSIWSKKITNDYYSKNGHLYGFIFPVQDLSAFRQVGCYLFANKGAGATIAGKYASSNSLIILQATQDDCSLEIGIAVNQDTTINSKIIYQTVDLTDMFGAGNEPTALDEFYATPQGKLYRGYVEYGYHILGAGEYKSNQLNDNNGNRHALVYGIDYTNDGTFTYAVGKIDGEYSTFYPKRNHLVKKDNIYMQIVSRENGEFGNYTVNGPQGASFTRLEHNANNNIMIYKILDDGVANWFCNVATDKYVNEKLVNIIVNLTELGLDHLTLDELKAQRPDLFVYKPYHETETRYGMILSDGRVHPLTGPLYGLNDIKDKGETVGKESRKYGVIKLKDLVWNSWWDDTTNPYRAYASIKLKKAGLSNMICSKYNVVDKMDGSLINGEMCGNKNNSYIYLKDTNYATFNDWKASLNDNDVIVYELNTSTTTQSTSTSIDMDTSVTNEEYTESFTPVEQWIAKYYSGTHAVLNYIPAVRNSDLKPGMYEVATGEFKTNEGTGEFTYINDWAATEPVTLKVDENKVEE